MDNNLTPKQEAFCLAYLETGNASEAYRRAYNTEGMKPETVNRTAKQLLDNHKITTRIHELQSDAAEATQITLQGHLEDLRRLRDAATEAKQYGAAVKAEMARGKAAGLYTERVNLTGGVELSQVEAYDFSGIPRETLLEMVREAWREDKGGGKA